MHALSSYYYYCFGFTAEHIICTEHDYDVIGEFAVVVFLTVLRKIKFAAAAVRKEKTAVAFTRTAGVQTVI